MEFEEKYYDVTLPRDLSAVTNALATRREPVVYHYDVAEVRQGSPARFLVMGENLWRSTRVTLGNQVTNKIEILPNMAGLVATFDRVTEPVNIDGTAREDVPVRLWTSDGVVLVSDVTIHPPRKITVEVAFAGTRLVATGGANSKVAIGLKLTKGRLLGGIAKIELGLKPRDTVGCDWIYESVPVKEGDVRAFTATFDVAKLCGGDKTKLPASGAVLEAALRVSLRPSSPRPDIVAVTASDASAVFYASPAEAGVRASCNSTDKPIKVGEVVTFTYPTQVRRGYPAFSQVAAEPEVEVKNAPKGVTFDIAPVDAGWGAGDPLTFKVKVGPKAGNLTDTQTAELHFKLKGTVEGLSLATAKCKLVKSGS